MEEQDIKILLNKYKAGTATDFEKAQLDKWYLDVAVDNVEELTEEERVKTLNNVLSNLEHLVYKRKKRVLWPRVAAAVFIILSSGGYFLLYKHSRNQRITQVVQDVNPANNQATLTLSSGKKVILSSTLNGRLGQEGNALVRVKEGHELTYTQTQSGSTRIEYNTLTTKRGEQSPFPLTLADGSKVWLNAASSITFPTSFSGKDRVVKITGEAYFEVVHNSAHPFKVLANGQTVEDIGTHFNINAYTEEPSVKTTLLEGGIKLSYGKNNVVLKPGQQAVLPDNNRDGAINIITANTKTTMAWKNGLFLFDRTDLKSVMRQISRWYDIDIIYKGNVSNDEFGGQISRNIKLSQMLKILESNDVHFKIEIEDNKKTLIITP